MTVLQETTEQQRLILLIKAAWASEIEWKTTADAKSVTARRDLNLRHVMFDNKSEKVLLSSIRNLALGLGLPLNITKAIEKLSPRIDPETIMNELYELAKDDPKQIRTLNDVCRRLIERHVVPAIPAVQAGAEQNLVVVL